MTEDGREELLYGELKMRQPSESEGLRVNMDTILLADFTRPRSGERILELGCAHGAISLILARRGFKIEGADIQPHLVEMARDNAAFNGLSELARFYEADLRDYRKNWQAQTYDRIVVNPPYGELSTDCASPSENRAAALHGSECSLEDVVAASKYLLDNRGRLDLIMRAVRAAELIALLERYNLAPKVLRPVYTKPGLDAAVVLIEAVRAGGKGLKIEAPLFVLDEDGKETRDYLAAYSLRR